MNYGTRSCELVRQAKFNGISRCEMHHLHKCGGYTHCKTINSVMKEATRIRGARDICDVAEVRIVAYTYNDYIYIRTVIFSFANNSYTDSGIFIQSCRQTDM